MLAKVPSAALRGIDGFSVLVEVHVSAGMPGFSIVGLPDTTCRESRDRVRAALQTSHMTWPQQRATVGLSPPGLRKAGAGLDLAIAIGLLVASAQLREEYLGGRAFLGALGLDGSIRPVPAALPMIDALDAEEIVIPAQSVIEARLVGRHRIRVAKNLEQLVMALTGEEEWPDLPPPEPPLPPDPGPDLADVRGQPAARFALEVAAAGGHHVLFVGSPGSGKTMLARRLPGLLPDLTAAQALETTRIHSAAGVALPPDGLIRRPPFRSPHHGASAVSLAGGGSGMMQPGEISLATNGVLFLDELGEFAPVVVDNLRQPLEEGVIRVARAATKATFPARVLLVAAMNPCPCSNGGPSGSCRCSPTARLRYARRLSGPLLDRFELRVEVGRPEVGDLLAVATGESTAAVAARVRQARERAAERGCICNSDLKDWQIEEYTQLSSSARAMVEGALRSGRLTGRGLTGIRRVALTVADLSGHDGLLDTDHVSAALALRCEPTFLKGLVA